MASLSTKSYDPSPAKFQRTKGAALTGSERAPSPSEASSAGDDGGVRIDLLSISDSPEAKYTPPHARQGFGQTFAQVARRSTTDSPTCVVDDRDDVFTSPTKTLKERRSERSVTVANMQRLDVALANEDQHPLRQRTSNPNNRHQINGVDAQNLFPPTACVFVANLPEPKDDVALEAAIYREFMKYGKCWVKIRRDSHHMPFAFVQFTSDAEAFEALEKGKGALIHGRPCRTEMVKANRTFIIQKKSGAAMTIQEAEKVLRPYGELSKCELLHPQLRDPLGFPPTILVEFSMFDATRDLHTAFRNDPVYNVQAFDLKKNCAATRNTSDEAFLAACERDRRSVFVGDLPSHVVKEDLEELFSEAGEILNINLIQRPTMSQVIRTIAFVEFSQPDMPETAIKKFDGETFMGATLRVERKTIKDRGPTPRHSRSQLLLTHKPSEENVRSVPARQPASPAGPPIVSTPSRPTASSGVEMSPAPVPPMYPHWGYGAMPGSPYGYNGHTGLPMTPQATPQMASPWSYYNNYWPNMMAYDPAYYMGMGPYGAFQSPTPMTSGGVGATTGGDDVAQSTPTRGISGQNGKDGDDKA